MYAFERLRFRYHVEGAARRIDLVIMLVFALVRTKLLAFVKKIFVLGTAEQLDVAGLTPLEKVVISRTCFL